MTSGDLRRLSSAVEALELQVRELRAEVRELADRHEGPGAATDPEPAAPSAGDSVRAKAELAVTKGIDGKESEAARVVALNMALEGKPRGEVAAYLRDEFGFADSEKLLDDVYSRVG